MNKTLRTLAKEYASGVINKEDYRSSRDKLLDGIVKGEIAVKAVEFRPPLKNMDLDVTQEKTTIRPPTEADDITAITVPDDSPVRQHQVSIPVTEPDSRENTGSQYLVISIVVIIVALIAVFSIIDLSDGEEHTIVVTNSSVDQVAGVNLEDEKVDGTSSVIEKSPAEILIENFLSENNWSENNLQAFKNEWNSLTPEEQRQGLESPVKSRLSNAIYQKLTEERALLGLGDSEAAIARQQTLVNFASELDINDPRLQVKTE